MMTARREGEAEVGTETVAEIKRGAAAVTESAAEAEEGNEVEARSQDEARKRRGVAVVIESEAVAENEEESVRLLLFCYLEGENPSHVLKKHHHLWDCKSQ